jgi:hypothetical protein
MRFVFVASLAEVATARYKNHLAGDEGLRLEQDAP